MSKLLVLLVFIVGCAATRLQVEERVPLNVLKPEPLVMMPVKFNVLADNEIVLYCVNAEGYKALSENMLKIRHYIRLQKEALTSYEEYYQMAD